MLTINFTKTGKRFPDSMIFTVIEKNVLKDKTINTSNELMITGARAYSVKSNIKINLQYNGIDFPNKNNKFLQDWPDDFHSYYEEFLDIILQWE